MGNAVWRKSLRPAGCRGTTGGLCNSDRRPMQEVRALLHAAQQEREAAVDQGRVETPRWGMR